VKVTVDPVRCGGTGYCVRLLPQVFRLGDQGPAEVWRAPGPDLAERVREAETLCPTNAIRVED
jgi:ferredoxin